MTKKNELDLLAAQEAGLSELCSNLSHGLHAAAQPLTILRASLDSSLTEKMSKAELRQLAARSAQEIERICLLFSLLKELVSAEKIKPELSAVPIEPVLAYALEGTGLLFEDSGMLLTSLVPEIGHPVLINKERFLQALSSILWVAHDLSRPLDTVELIASSHSSNAVRVVVRNLNSQADSLDAARKLNLVVAEAHIRGQQGNFSWSLNPFIVQIDLRKASVVS
jgi:hypothetical protein